MNRKIKALSLTLAILLSVFFIVFGGYDDSPGLQLIGLLIVIFSAMGLMRRRRRDESK